ncbi:MAG: glycoside hydrolase family 3 C-terminal domain-containing protein [Clostridia bacterium]|nr:glycoside hydrolase family 3 C-terminal domain-containing protein [Clostridia bacterium]
MKKWQNEELSFEERAVHLTNAMSLKEKAGRMNTVSEAIPNLGIAEKNWGLFELSEMQNIGFPSSINMAATFNEELVQDVSGITDGEQLGYDDYKECSAIIRTEKLSDILKRYGEDKCLAAKIAAALRAGSTEYKKNSEAAYAIHIDMGHHILEDDISKRQLYEMLYSAIENFKESLAAFIVDINAKDTDSKNSEVLTILANIASETQFQGLIIGKLNNVDNSILYAAWAVNNGCHMLAGAEEGAIYSAAKKGLIKEELINSAARRVMLAEMRIESMKPDNGLTEAKKNETNKRLAAESLVLLKNKKLLPLLRENVKKIALVGPNADNENAMAGTESRCITVLDGLKQAYSGAEVIYAQGCGIDGYEDEALLEEAVWAAEQADVVIIATGFETGGQRGNSLPPVQETLIDAVCGVGVPAVLINFSDEWVDLSLPEEVCTAILQCWHPGIFGGEIIAGMLFGGLVPCGKLPVTFYKDIEGTGRTGYPSYGYYEGEPLYPFGYGLSYSFVEYYRIYLSEAKIKAGEDITVTIFVKNKGRYETKDVIQAYIADEESKEDLPLIRLAAHRKVFLPINEEVKVSLTIEARHMQIIKEDGSRIIEPGRFSIYLGGGQPDDITAALYRRDCLHIGFLVE